MIKLKVIERESKSDIETLILDWAKKATPIYDGKFSEKNLKVASSIIAAFYVTTESIPSYNLADLIERVLLEEYIYKKAQCTCFKKLDQDIKNKFDIAEKKLISYCFLTAINIPQDFSIEQDKLGCIEGYEFTFVDPYPEKFGRTSSLEAATYRKVIIKLDAYSPDIALNKAYKFLLTKLAIWSLLYTKCIFSFENNKSLNVFGLGEMHTLHSASDGKMLRKYVELNYISRPKWSIQFEGVSDSILSKSYHVEQNLHKLKYSKKVIDTLCSYIIAANEFNHMNLLRELWTAIEVLNKKEKPRTIPKKDIGTRENGEEANSAKSAISRCCKSIGRDEKLLLNSARIIRNISTHNTYKSDYAKYICQELCSVFLDVLIYHSDVDRDTNFDDALPKVEQVFKGKKNQVVVISL